LIRDRLDQDFAWLGLVEAGEETLSRKLYAVLEVAMGIDYKNCMMHCDHGEVEGNVKDCHLRDASIA
jgi:hypothetical protein